MCYGEQQERHRQRRLSSVQAEGPIAKPSQLLCHVLSVALQVAGRNGQIVNLAYVERPLLQGSSLRQMVYDRD